MWGERELMGQGSHYVAKSNSGVEFDCPDWPNILNHPERNPTGKEAKDLCS